MSGFIWQRNPASQRPLPLTVRLGAPLAVRRPQFPHPQKGDNSTYPEALLAVREPEETVEGRELTVA